MDQITELFLYRYLVRALASARKSVYLANTSELRSHNNLVDGIKFASHDISGMFCRLTTARRAAAWISWPDMPAVGSLRRKTAMCRPRLTKNTHTGLIRFSL